MKITKHVAKGRPDLKFWAKQDNAPGFPSSFAVISQADGFPATEAHDDYFANFEDADEVAKELADNYVE